MNRYLRIVFHYLFGNLNRQVVAIATNSYFSLYYSFILCTRIVCIARWHLRMLATYFVDQLSFIFHYDVLNKPQNYETSIRNKVLTFTGSCYYFFFLFFTVLLYRNTADRPVWSHLYDLVVRNREQVGLQWQSAAESESESSNYRNSRIFYKISAWLNRLKTVYPRLQLLPSARRLLYYPNLEPKVRLKAVRICLLLEVVMVFICIYYLNYFLFFYIVNHLPRLRQPMTAAQLLTTAVVYFSILHTSFYTYAGLLLVELALYLVCTIYVDQYRVLGSELEKLLLMRDLKFQLSNDDKISKRFASNSLHRINRTTAAYRAVHTRFTVFILRFNDSLISPVIAYYLHYYLPYHSYRSVYIYFQQRSLPLAMTLYNYWFLAFMWLFLMVITLAAARTNSAISGRSGRALSAIQARKGLLVRKSVNSDQKRQSYYSAKESVIIETREALKLSAYFEMIWREEKRLAFTAGQTDTAMSWRFILEIAILYSSFVFYFTSKFIHPEDSSSSL